MPKLPNAQAQHISASIGATAQKLSALFPTVDSASDSFVLSIEDASIRLSVNETVPTTVLGQKFVDGDIIELSRAEFEEGQIIAISGTAVLQLSQYSER